jgi:threonyl-tRNA synthetase
VRAELAAAGLRVEVDADNEPMRVKIAKAQQQKVPYMLVVGDKEAEGRLVAVRDRSEGDIGQRSLGDFTAMVKAVGPAF